MTTISVRMTPEQLAQLSLRLCNVAGGTEGVLDPEYVWLSPDSLGGREIVGDAPVDTVVIDLSIGARWDAYEISGIVRVKWESQTSGATVTAVAGDDGDFEVTYRHDPYDGVRRWRRHAESYYLEHMLQVSDDLLGVDDSSLTPYARARLGRVTPKRGWQRNFTDRELVLMGE